MTKKILDITLSLFLLICAIVIFFFVVNEKNIVKYYSTTFEAQNNTAIELKNALKNISTEYFSIMENQVQAQKNLYESSKIISTVILETGIALGAGAMEKEGNLSSANAKKIINQSIDKITIHSERVGILAKALNDVLRNQFINKPIPEILETKPIPNQKSVSGRFVTNSTAGTLFVLTGRVENPSNIVYSHIEIRGALITKDKEEAKIKNAFCGNIITDEMLKTGNMSDINTLLTLKEGAHKINVKVAPGTSVPFMVVFSDLPEKLHNFTIKIASFDKSIN